MKNQVRDSKSLGDRMKEYEKAYDFKFTKRTPIIMRLDGRSFHNLTKHFKKPYDISFISLMNNTARYLCENIQGVKLAYVQSDEITILIKYYDTLNSEPWFNNELQKMISISAGLASSYFTFHYNSEKIGDLKNVTDIDTVIEMSKKLKIVEFDSRAFTIPEHDVCNNFIWRQQDWERNSIQMLGQDLFSQKELNKKSCKDIITMCEEKGQVWSNLPTSLKRGRCIVKHEGAWTVDNEIPLFKDNREYIERFLMGEINETRNS